MQTVRHDDSLAFLVIAKYSFPLARHFLWIYPEVFADTTRGVLFDLCMPGDRRALTVSVFPD